MWRAEQAGRSDLWKTVEIQMLGPEPAAKKCIFVQCL